MHTWAIALACGTWLGCDSGGDCVPTEDLSGSWHGTYSTSKMPNTDIDLVLQDDGSRIEGSFSTSTGASGTVSGVQAGGTIAFEVRLSSPCQAELTATVTSCGETLGLRMTGEDCDGKHQGTGTLRRDMPIDGGSSGECEYADDGECDEPEGSGLCAQGTDPKDCLGTCVGADCQPQPMDCRISPSTCPSFCVSTNDGICDEDTGRCRFGTDTADCSVTPPMQLCARNNDGICDEPEGTGLCIEGSDFSDCFTTPPIGCQLTNDGICDEPEGTGICAEGTDVVDCIPDPPQFCARVNDGICDEPEGTSFCAEGTDVADCAPVACGSAICTGTIGTMPIATARPCCFQAFESTCGISLLGGTCVEVETPIANACADYSFMGILVPACCLPRGACGIALPDGSGCVPTSAVTASITEVLCQGIVDEDAGVD